MPELGLLNAELVNEELVNEELVNEEEILLKAGRLFTEAHNNIPRRIAAVKEICTDLLHCSPAEQSIYIANICKTYNLTKKIFQDELKFQSEQLEDESPAEIESKQETPHITHIENFISNRYKIRYNEISNRFEHTENPKNKEEEKEWEEMNEYNILRKLRKSHYKTTITELIEILKSDFTPKYNPFVDYFNSLPAWDGEDHINKLAGYLKVDDRKRFDVQFKKMFVRTIACGLEVDFNKHIFTFVGKGVRNQNMGKSSLIRWLVPPILKNYYTEEVPKDKDALIALAENIIINLDELSTFNKMEINWLKSILSKDLIKVRLPFDKRASTLKRRCNFLASTNEAKFLTDLTGNVRWICFFISDIDFAYSKDIDIDKIWSQAYHYFKNGINGKRFDYQLSRIEIEENEIANLEFMNLPAEMELIPKYFTLGTATDNHAFYTASDFVKSLTEKVTGSIRFFPGPVGKALRSLGFEQSEKRIEGSMHPVKGYYVKFLTPDIAEDVLLEREDPF